MKKEELELLREEYKSLIRQKEEIIELERKIKLLEKLPEVKEYIEAINLYNEKTYKKNNMEKKDNSYFINRIINTHKITPTNDIYVYIGTYKYSDEIDIVHCSNDILVDRNNNKADYCVYYNLEVGTYNINSSVEIPYIKADEFEKKHNIIFPNNVLRRKEYFYDLQNEYFETAILESEEKALEKIKKLFKKFWYLYNEIL